MVIRSELTTDRLENTLIEVFERLHKCPWYKILFRKDYIRQYSYNKGSSGIGYYITVHCNRCGENFDATNYKNW